MVVDEVEELEVEVLVDEMEGAVVDVTAVSRGEVVTGVEVVGA